MNAAEEFRQILAIDKEARRLERVRVMGLFEELKEVVFRRVFPGDAYAEVEAAVRQFEKAVEETE